MNRSLRTQRDDQGVVALEVVIVLPILLTLIMVTVTLGAYLGEKSNTIGLAHQGARAVSLGRPLPIYAGTDFEVVVPCPPTGGSVTVQATRSVSLPSFPLLPIELLDEDIVETATFPCAP